MARVRITGASFSPDASKLLFSTNETGVFNAYEVPVDGGTPRQLTHSTDNAIFAVGYFPADERFLYSSDGGGNELTHVLVGARDGTVRDLTPGDNVRAAFRGCTHDGRSFFVQTNERDPRFMDLYEHSVDDYARQLFYTNEGGLSVGAISRDKRWLALIKPRTTSDSDIYLLELATGTLKNITLQRAHPVPGQPRLRRLRHQQPTRRWATRPPTRSGCIAPRRCSTPRTGRAGRVEGRGRRLAQGCEERIAGGTSVNLK